MLRLDGVSRLKGIETNPLKGVAKTNCNVWMEFPV